MHTYDHRVDFERLLSRVEKLGGTILSVREEDDSLFLIYSLKGVENKTFLISHPNSARRQTMRFIYNTWHQEFGNYRLDF